jgi:Fe-S-cluster-containing hydrogenase component 2
MPVNVIKERCPQNHRCPALAVCPVAALTQKENLAPEVDATLCTDCGACVDFCPKGALKLDAGGSSGEEKYRPGRML